MSNIVLREGDSATTSEPDREFWRGPQSSARRRRTRGDHLRIEIGDQRPLDASVLRDQLSESLPKYMVSSAIHWRRRLPLTDNGKIDRKALRALAGELDVAEQGQGDRPSTATEQRLAAAWSEVLGIPKDQIGRRDQFFDLGGSLSALRLGIALDRTVSFKDLNEHPIPADLADIGSTSQGIQCSRIHPVFLDFEARVVPYAPTPLAIGAASVDT